MADLKLTADFTDIQTLKRELLDIPKKARDSARTFEAEYARVERSLIKQARQFEKNAAESQKYYSQLLKLGGQAKSAERSAEVFTKALEKQEQAAQRVGKVFRDQTSQAVRSLAKEFARSGDQSAYLSGINKIVKAQNMLQTGSRMSRSEIMRLGVEFRQQAKFANELAVAQIQAGAAAGGLGRNVNRTGVLTQQAGYQIGDFIVQVQSGTNAFVAFGQQATQVAGTLTLLGGKWIGIGTALGIAIPLLTAVGAGLMRTRKDSEEAGEAFDGIGDTLSRLEDIRLNSIGESLAEGAKAAMTQWQPLFNLLERVESRNLQENLSRSINETIQQLASANVQLQPRTNLPSISSLFGYPREAPAPATGPFGFTDKESRAAVAQQLLRIEGNTREELQASLAATEERLRQQQLLTPEVESVLATLADELGLVNTITKQVEQGQDVQQKINDILAERVESYTETQQTVNDTVDSLNRQIAAQERIIRFGKDSELVAKRTTEAILEEEAARLRAAGATEEEIDRVIELKKELIEVTEEAESLESAISNINKISMGSVIAQVANLASVLNITTEAAMALAGVLPTALTRERAIAQAGTSGGRGSAGMPIPGQFGLQSTAYPNAGQIAQDLLNKEAGKDKWSKRSRASTARDCLPSAHS
jgi:hypothetical protein